MNITTYCDTCDEWLNSKEEVEQHLKHELRTVEL